MKKLSWFLVLAMMAFACQLQNEEIASSENVSGAPVAGNYLISSTFSTDGKTLTLVIDQSGAQDISHMTFKFTDCDGKDVTTNNVTAVTVNDIDWFSEMKSTDGQGGGNSCFGKLADPFIKLDNFEDGPSIVTVVFSFDVAIADGNFLIKSATDCFGIDDPDYSVSRDCTPVICYEYKGETAWAAGTRYVQRGNWATYTAYDGHAKTVNVFAGQTHWAGTASFSAADDGKVTITIELEEGWSLKEGDNSVKIQPYSSTPPASNPSPGRFQYKGTSLVVEVDEAAFYGIHLDVVTKREVPCE